MQCSVDDLDSVCIDLFQAILRGDLSTKRFGFIPIFSLFLLNSPREISGVSTTLANDARGLREGLKGVMYERWFQEICSVVLREGSILTGR